MKCSSFLCHKIKQRFHFFGPLLFKNAVSQHQVHEGWYLNSDEETVFSMSKIHFIANDEVTILESNSNAKNKKGQEDPVIEAKTLTRTL